ncbi:hypothetical protein SO802_025472 [Lithocarpus litseifolius]|uniref:Uncharacterized protein n=1 Tax=Lithocarpus litseifolius TaxID=425828 RepID=A0AAW2BYT7_9ROSI
MLKGVSTVDKLDTVIGINWICTVLKNVHSFSEELNLSIKLRFHCWLSFYTCIGARWMVRNEPGNSSGVREFMGHPICALNLADIGYESREEKIKPRVLNTLLSDGSLTFSPVWCEV